MSCPVQQNVHTGEKASGTAKVNGEDKPASGEYMKWDAEGVEVVPPEEEKKIYEVSAQFNRFQMMNLCVMGKFTVHHDLPKHLAQGMFAKPGTYDVIMRYSSLTPKIVPDNIPAPRGIGMKIFGIEGEKLYGEDMKTQDWTFNNYPILELRDPKTTYDIADSLERNWNDLATFGKEQSERVDADVATHGSQLPRQQSKLSHRENTCYDAPAHTTIVVAMPQYSQSAYRHGDYVAKYGVFPIGAEQKKIENEDVKESDPMNILSQHTRAFHMKNKVTYSFCAQLLQDLKEQPVDDLGVEWDAKKYPFEQVATIEFEPQDSWLPEFRVWWDDRYTASRQLPHGASISLTLCRITVNSWHGLKTHQPLGSTNRMRRVVYAESRKLRLRVNGYKDYVEPASLKEVPVPIPTPQFDLPLQSAVSTVEVAS
ncbi:hypothetical protein LTR91_021457 [Friedmanniomyces endolithicus]|uniref:Catalase core domain-containing protein n=1 Tax=Friedmanniomyces endolithicus TaxID=329885 RepID=A0AAN6H7Z2_9PEZI|nr:hypothetical protein LTR94_010709 [Friedmanniomyces endolithicus]KAK0861676.1 hypothetical protein LTS02_007685 [Friedmanniomyces endolithicus]KAK0954546.1 hypothetical protein LTS01_023852 [Friedmanniomyces endolithicus]KAK0958186.1 hypothetical protein LTR91_021457 [Friedmanniomyces endolithicus]KAK1035286.1 hypothetical protein LTS16_014742 [Friedmanniomyces endolithicus]